MVSSTIHIFYFPFNVRIILYIATAIHQYRQQINEEFSKANGHIWRYRNSIVVVVGCYATAPMVGGTRR